MIQMINDNEYILKVTLHSLNLFIAQESEHFSLIISDPTHLYHTSLYSLNHPITPLSEEVITLKMRYPSLNSLSFLIFQVLLFENRLHGELDLREMIGKGGLAVPMRDSRGTVAAQIFIFVNAQMEDLELNQREFRKKQRLYQLIVVEDEDHCFAAAVSKKYIEVQLSSEEESSQIQQKKQETQIFNKNNPIKEKQKEQKNVKNQEKEQKKEKAQHSPFKLIFEEQRQMQKNDDAPKISLQTLMKTRLQKQNSEVKYSSSNESPMAISNNSSSKHKSLFESIKKIQQKYEPFEIDASQSQSSEQKDQINEEQMQPIVQSRDSSHHFEEIHDVEAESKEDEIYLLKNDQNMQIFMS